MSGSLTREVDLIPQASDLDNMFESDSESNDDAVSLSFETRLFLTRSDTNQAVQSQNNARSLKISI